MTYQSCLYTVWYCSVIFMRRGHNTEFKACCKSYFVYAVQIFLKVLNTLGVLITAREGGQQSLLGFTKADW